MGGLGAQPWGRAGPGVTFDAAVPENDRIETERLFASFDPTLFGREIEISLLPGGANNRNYVVRSGASKYALRIANAQRERLAVDRASALRAQQDAAAVGVAPGVLAYQLPEGHFLSDFVEGAILDEESVTDRNVLTLVAATLRRLHAAQSACRTYSPFEDIRVWTGFARADGTTLPDDYDELLAAAVAIERVMERVSAPAVFCHNDTVPQNFILAGDRIVLVDWDYAGRGWAAFELASFAATAQLDDDLEDVLLRAYDDCVTDAQRATVQLLRFVAALRETAWALMATPLLSGQTSPLDGWSYESYLETHLEIARRDVASATFSAALERASSGVTERGW